jgi:hypothetical protein
MTNQNELNHSTDAFVLEKIEDIWRTTCGSWDNVNESTVQSFLSKCEKHSIDPQFCMSWIQKHNEKIPNWSAVSDTTREWVVQHTSTGSPISNTRDNIS